MEHIFIGLGDSRVEIRCPADIGRAVRLMFPDNMSQAAPTRSRVVVEEAPRGLYALRDGAGYAASALTRDDLPTFIMEAALRNLLVDLDAAVALHAGAVALDGGAIVVVGASGAGKSSLVAWLVDKGFDYLTDEIVLVPDNGSGLQGFRRALVAKPGAVERVAELPAFRDVQRVRSGSHWALAAPQSEGAHSVRSSEGRLIIFPRFAPGAALEIQAVSSAKAGLRLMECNLNARNLADGGFRATSGLARRAPAITLDYGDFDQLEGVLDALTRAALADAPDVEAARERIAPFLRAATSSAAPRAPERAPPRPRPPKTLTIGMATYDDYDGVYFTIQSLRLHHPEVAAAVEFVVIDNHPDGPCAAALVDLGGHVQNYHYVPMKNRSGTAVRDVVFEEAVGEFVLCMDCHILAAPGALKRLLDYFAAHPDTKDLIQGPMLRDDLANHYTHWAPIWRGGMFGAWETDSRADDIDAPAFDIPLQGLGLFACRRAAWPGLNPNFRGFGGEEGYIHEKFRRRGGRTLCLPSLRWLHRFNRPMGVPYKNTWEDRIRNYMIGYAELDMPTLDMEAHFEEVLGEKAARSIFENVRRELGEDTDQLVEVRAAE